jgi:hypothetical protein
MIRALALKGQCKDPPAIKEFKADTAYRDGSQPCPSLHHRQASPPIHEMEFVDRMELAREFITPASGYRAPRLSDQNGFTEMHNATKPNNTWWR